MLIQQGILVQLILTPDPQRIRRLLLRTTNSAAGSNARPAHFGHGRISAIRKHRVYASARLASMSAPTIRAEATEPSRPEIHLTDTPWMASHGLPTGEQPLPVR